MPGASTTTRRLATAAVSIALAAGCTIGDDPDPAAFCLGAGFAEAAVLDGATGRVDVPADQPDFRRRLLRRLFDDRFVEAAPPPARRWAAHARRAARDAQDGRISDRDRERYLQAFRQIERKAASTCDP